MTILEQGGVHGAGGKAALQTKGSLSSAADVTVFSGEPRCVVLPVRAAALCVSGVRSQQLARLLWP